MSSKAETASMFVEDCDQIIRDNVLICIFKNKIIEFEKEELIAKEEFTRLNLYMYTDDYRHYIFNISHTLLNCHLLLLF